jgi:hypothetical protein
MAFAIFYNRADLTPIAAEATRVDLSSADRRFAQACWSGGLSGWNTAPLAPEQYRCVDSPLGYLCDDDCRIVVVDAKVSGQPVTLADFVAFLRRQSELPGGTYLGNIADDIEGGAGGVEPWPV